MLHIVVVQVPVCRSSWIEPQDYNWLLGIKLQLLRTQFLSLFAVTAMLMLVHLKNQAMAMHIRVQLKVWAMALTLVPQGCQIMLTRGSSATSISNSDHSLLAVAVNLN